MDGHRFDDLARAAAGSQSRRALLKRLVATAAGGVLTSLLPARSVLAQECVVTCTDPYVLDPATCQCVCGPDTTPTFNIACCPNANVCGDACMGAPCEDLPCHVCDPNGRGEGLGACVSACTDNQTCQSGTCVGAKCPKGQAECGGVCITTSSDPANCGGCGKVCKAGQVCQSGKCV